jgi:transposase-like protein
MSKFTEEQLNDAKTCLECPICKKARKKQKGFAYWFVRLVDRKVCPKCQAFEAVFNRRAFEPITDEEIKAVYGS